VKESWSTRGSRWLFNFWPCYRGTGARVTFIASDWSVIRVRLPLSLRTRNYVGTIFGGSIYASVDPFYMLMLIKRLGPDVIVWDKSAAIRFRKPGRSPLMAEFRLENEEIQSIRASLATTPKLDRTYVVKLLDASGEVHAEIEKVVQVRQRTAAPS
jgi:hypothetical protein